MLAVHWIIFSYGRMSFSAVVLSKEMSILFETGHKEPPELDANIRQQDGGQLNSNLSR